MTTKVLEVAKIRSYLPLETRLEHIEHYSKGAHRRNPEFSIEHWTLSQFYYLLLEEYKMPEYQARALIDLCTSCNVSVKELGAMLDEELLGRFGGVVLPERTLPYVSLAILEKMLDKGGYRATKELRKQLVPPKRKVKKV